MNLVRTYYVQKLEKEDQKSFNWKKVKNIYFSSCPNFVFARYSLISSNLHIILKKITYMSRCQRGTSVFKIEKKFGYKSKYWDPNQNSKYTIYPLGVNT